MQHHRRLSAALKALVRSPDAQCRATCPMTAGVLAETMRPCARCLVWRSQPSLFFHTLVWSHSQATEDASVSKVWRQGTDKTLLAVNTRTISAEASQSVSL